MPARRRLLALAFVALGATAAFAQPLKVPKVDLDYDKDVDFTAFKTYSWKSPASPADDVPTHTSIVWYVERELEKKGLKKAPEGEGDLFVRYYAKASQSLKGTPTQGQGYLPGGTGSLSTGVDFQRVLEGTLILELQRASDGKPVWRAGSGYAPIDKKRLDAETSSAVRWLLSKYPPPKS